MATLLKDLIRLAYSLEVQPIIIMVGYGGMQAGMVLELRALHLDL